jgi:Xaa-Pro aminopeptidase
MSDFLNRLKQLRASIKPLCDAFILPLTDEFMGEYIPDSENSLGWLTGFSGSAGAVVIMQDKAVFFTDGRYMLQAKDEVGGVFEVVNSADLSMDNWLAQNLKIGAKIVLDAKLHTINSIKRIQKKLQDVPLELELLSHNPIDEIWSERPAPPASKVVLQPLKYTGMSSLEKCKSIANYISKNKADILFVTANDSLCWLLNMRGADVPCTPFVRVYGALHKDGVVDVFIDEKRIDKEVIKSWRDSVRIHNPAALQQWFEMQGKQGKTIAVDPVFASAWVEQQCTQSGAKVVLMDDPCQLAKACKNEAEIAGTQDAHARDGLALTRFLHYLSQHHANMTEQDVCDKLLEFRRQDAAFLEPSFPTISGSGANGAIVHYRTTPKSNKKLEQNSLMLIDSGGQYQGGTTDVTRTVAIGTPSQEMKECFTRVLKGHIALATAIFPEGTNGMQLDALARQYLWAVGLDYDHGTGHGVGSYLSVHEGPQRISKKSSDVALRAGMIISNEPGYYKAGAFGIRTENLVVVVERFIKDGKKFFGFETLTLAPIDRRLVVDEMLSEEESKWLNNYHQKVFETHKNALSDDVMAWLKSEYIITTVK